MRLLLALLVTVTVAVAQPQLEFEVASVRLGDGLSPSMNGGPGTANPTRISYENVGLRGLLTKAWDVGPAQVSGPGWMDTEKFSIAARIPSGTTREQFRVMLQNLLVDRFQLAFHHETKELPVDELRVTTTGPKFSRAAPQDPDDSTPVLTSVAGPRLALDKEGCPVLRSGVSSGGGQSGPGGSCFRYMKYTLSDLAVTLSTLISMSEGRYGADSVHIIDKTGLAGEYDFTLKFRFTPVIPGQTSAMDGPGGPTIYTALEQQLGLKLQKTKAPLDVIVIDKASRIPTEN